LAQRLSGMVALGALTLLALVALMNGPEIFLFHLKRGSLSSAIVIFVGATSAWLLLLLAGRRARRHDTA
jgi:hypothetical protein